MLYKHEKWKNLEDGMSRYTDKSSEIIEALQDLYSIYDDGLWMWLTSLYDKESGGFYFSNSARDNPEYFPDIESTAQALNFAVGLGVLDSPSDLPEEMKQEIRRFTLSLMDSEDGFFYHPQWGKSISDSRRGRDLNWANQLSENFNFRFPYPTANERLRAAFENKDDESAKNIPEHLRSAESLKKYLDKYDWDNRAYYSGNNIGAQMPSIIAAGLEDVVVDYLNALQNPATGLWGNRSSYGAINALLKIGGVYSRAKRPMKGAMIAARAALECALHEDDLSSSVRDEKCLTVTHIYNCWFAIRLMLKNLKEFGNEDQAEALLREVYASAPDAIRASKKKILRFKCPDGSFTYDLEMGLNGLSQEAPVCVPNTFEGSINSSSISSAGLVGNIYMALGIDDEFKVPIFDSSVKEEFLQALNK